MLFLLIAAISLGCGDGLFLRRGFLSAFAGSGGVGGLGLSDVRLSFLGSFHALLFGVHERIGPAHFVLVGAPPFPRPSDICECGRLCERYRGFAEAGVLAVSCENLTDRFSTR